MKKNTKKEATASIEHEDSYIRAYEDIELLNKPVMRPVRIELEVMKPELYLQALNITQSVVCFGSARVKPQKEAKAAVEAAQKALAKKPKSKALQERLSEAQGLLSLSKYYEVGRAAPLKTAAKAWALTSPCRMNSTLIRISPKIWRSYSIILPYASCIWSCARVRLWYFRAGLAPLTNCLKF